MPESPSDRRRHPRVPLNATARVHVLFPEETFRPAARDCVVEDISAAGIRVSVSGVTDDFHRLIIRAVRFAKVELTLPGSGAEMELQGKVVWVGYDNRRHVPSCSLGIMFDRLPDVQRGEILRFLQTLSR